VNAPTVLALDFDGVVCDGMNEYFQTAWSAHCVIWNQSDKTPPDGVADRFYRLRPVVETGWEMPVLVRAIMQGMPESQVLQDWLAISSQMLVDDSLKPTTIAAIVDEIRDRWIATDLDNWLAHHRFYPGVVERLRQFLDNGLHLVIISTKEGRFIQKLLQQQTIFLSDQQIFGKEVNRPKHQTLRELAIVHVGASFWFVEDRVKTLQGIIQQPDMTTVQLFLAEWGYNTQRDRDVALHDPRIHLLTLNQFGQDFSAWIQE